MNEWTLFEPACGWAAFNDSEHFIDTLSKQLPATDWHYLNFGSSVWESRRDSSMLLLHEEDEKVTELQATPGDAFDLINLIAPQFHLVPLGKAS